ncbi:response regulator transcription factor [Paludibaculum fermentans]|uniref:Response regulator transcription factor n=1 Tax=Paludibaculum fermentans TaxID=1473598 RepID=A0A7S7SML1_PALFE|nr:response regulator transcription factor [Paludibaculum fermentans]
MGNSERRPGIDRAVQLAGGRHESSVNPEEATVYVVDDDVSVREAIRNLLRSVGLKVESFRTAQDFLVSDPRGLGCLILDVRLPGASGLELQRQLIERNREIPIIFITGHGDIPMSVKAIKAGAVEFLTKPFRDQDLLDAVQQAIDRDLERRSREQEMSDLRERHASLTPRELEVMRFVVRGLINKQIASEMGVTESTVKMHRGQLMLKMKAESLADLIRAAERFSQAEEG